MLAMTPVYSRGVTGPYYEQMGQEARTATCHNATRYPTITLPCWAIAIKSALSVATLVVVSVSAQGSPARPAPRGESSAGWNAIFDDQTSGPGEAHRLLLRTCSSAAGDMSYALRTVRDFHMMPNLVQIHAVSKEGYRGGYHFR